MVERLKYPVFLAPFGCFVVIGCGCIYVLNPVALWGVPVFACFPMCWLTVEVQALEIGTYVLPFICFCNLAHHL